MLDELLMREQKNGETVLSLSKVFARLTYFVAGFGTGCAAKAIYHRVK